MPSLYEVQRDTASPQWSTTSITKNTLDKGHCHSPMKPIPVELISDIFTWASHSSDELHDSISQPITISHVCRLWRRVSLSTTSLWTTIFLTLPLSHNQLTRTATWIVRSRNRPLHIHMDFRDPAWAWDEAVHSFHWKAMENIMRLILPQAPRWQHIELLTDTWAPIFTFLSYTARVKSAPLLQDIRLARCNAYFVAKGEPFRPANMAHPIAWFGGGAGLRGLRKISLAGVHVDWANAGLTGLKDLELKYHSQQVMPTLEEFVCIMHANPELERLVILGWGPHIDESLKDATQIVQLLHLKEFELGFVDVDYAIDMLSIFCVPNIQELIIEDVASGINPSQNQDSSRFFDYLSVLSDETSSPYFPLRSLRSLSLRGVLVANDSIHRFMSHLHSMKSLCLAGIDALSLHALCAAVSTCASIATLTLKDIDAAAAASVLEDSLKPLPSYLRILVDIYSDQDDLDAAAIAAAM
ncbi:hypothetical protein HYDPIDRAFT_117624 [Hydnomerulius pinastri MD-312]|uniref:F-box domain-containing protein n=1 Tax=Hydnomerulius pinastri MD-312 TaxID=994086 RepID=A0A0C9WAI2_9AGAM|nr:hypothetical protein HYDPIDRAFT_117624 [Hydnomerulius pinastri MD-312]